jgi:UrcA family protein
LSNFTARLAAFALIALPVVTLGAAAHARVSVQLAGLDLASGAGKAALAHRVNIAADQACGDERTPSILNACKAAVTAEVTERLASFAPGTRFAALPSAHTRASIRIADLNLASADGKSAFDQRMNAAADGVCRDERNLSIQAGCRSAIRSEASEKLAMIMTGVQYAAR